MNIYNETKTIYEHLQQNQDNLWTSTTKPRQSMNIYNKTKKH